MVLCALIACLAAAAQPAAERPYLVLVSLDGFRYDYAKRYQAANLTAIGRQGVRADLIPSFPTVTFPNHLSIVTGRYPERHGIVANTFFDPSRNAEFSMDQSAELGAWLNAKPLWVLAEEQGVRTASMFWPMSDSEFGGVRPSLWFRYDSSVPNPERVRRVLDWLKLPEGRRPRFITLYISDVDSAGHEFGPGAAETAEAVRRVDALVGELWRGIQSLRLPVNLVVVSDHGMQEVRGVVNLGDLADLTRARVILSGPLAMIHAADAEPIYRALRKSALLEVYRRQGTPRRWHFSASPRIGDLVVLARQPVRLAIGPPQGNSARGQHGHDPARFPEMRGIFLAAGPDVRPGAAMKPFENIHVFPFLTRLLRLPTPGRVDQAILSPAIRH